MSAKYKLLYRCLQILVICSLFACQEKAKDNSMAPVDSFGLPGKGDQLCDPKSILCWVGTDADHARYLMEIEAKVLLGEQTSDGFILALVNLQHKFTAEEKDALELFKHDLGMLPSDDSEQSVELRKQVVKFGFENVYGRVISGYWGAHATLFSNILEQSTSSTLSEKADSSVPGTQIPSSLPIDQGLKPALDTLWSQGPLGQYLVTMLTLSGATAFDTDVRSIINRDLAVQKPIDFEAEEIVKRYSRSAAIDSFYTGMASAIPVAGIWISVPYGIYAQFKNRARLTIELGQLYGLDPQNPNDFLLIVQSMVSSQGFKELFSSFYQALVGAQGYKMIAGRHGNQYLVGESDFSERRVDELVKLSLGQLAIYGVRILETIVARATGNTVKSLLGQVTFGVSTLAEITIDYFTVSSMGRELRYTLHPWGWAIYLESMMPLTEEAARVCAHSALMEVARVDDHVNEAEAMLMQMALIRPFHAEDLPLGASEVMPTNHDKDASWVAFVDPDLILEQVANARWMDPFRCMSYTWADEDTFTQLSLLSWLELMATSDGPLNEQEEQLLLGLGTFFSVQEEESRVYDAMRERVAAYPRAFGYIPEALWMWSNQGGEELEYLTGDELRQEIWQAMR